MNTRISIAVWLVLGAASVFLATTTGCGSDSSGDGDSSSSSNSYCYDNDCNGVKSGKKCFDSKDAYCQSLCAESDCISVEACKNEC